MEQALDSLEGHIPVKFLTPKQFMDQTHLSRNTVYEGIKDGSIPSIRISKRKILIPADALDRRLTESRVDTTVG
ncbi:MAG: helix-turn-helix domain-containing protein [Chloroflexi bacterium]|nr:helix-turn-helix domain-containing protein [Chloroflexota bacterium]